VAIYSKESIIFGASSVDFSLSGEQLSYLKYHNIISLVIFDVNCIKSYNFDDYGLQLIKKTQIQNLRKLEYYLKSIKKRILYAEMSV